MQIRFDAISLETARNSGCFFLSFDGNKRENVPALRLKDCYVYVRPHNKRSIHKFLGLYIPNEESPLRRQFYSSRNMAKFSASSAALIIAAVVSFTTAFGWVSHLFVNRFLDLRCILELRQLRKN